MRLPTFTKTFLSRTQVIKVLGFTKSVSINLIVKKIEDTDLFLSYSGKMGIDMLVSPAISYAKKLVPEKAGWVEHNYIR